MMLSQGSGLQRLRDRLPRGEATYLGSLLAITLAFFLFALFWALALPPFEGPDERDHYNSVARLADGGGWPRPYEAEVLGSTWQARAESGLAGSGGAFQNPLVAPDERAAFLESSGIPNHGRDGMVQHPPTYYLLGALVLTVVGTDDLRWDHASLLLCSLSALLVAAAVPFIAGAVRHATGSRWAGILAAIFPLFVPWFVASASRISNDTLLITAVSATVYALVRSWRDPKRLTWLLVMAGIAYGIALGTKGYAMMLAPVVVVLAVGAVWRERRGIRRGSWQLALAGMLALVFGGWWWVRNLIILGKLQPSRYGAREGRGQAEPSDGYSFEWFAGSFFERLNATFWDRIGYVHDDGFGEIVAFAGVGLVLMLVVGLLVSRAQSRLLLVALLSYPAIIVGTLFTNSHGIYWDFGHGSRGIQGRYLFSGIVAFALAFAIAARWAAGRLVAPMRAGFTVVIGVTAAVVVALSLRAGVPVTWASRDAGTPASIGEPASFMDISIAAYATLLAFATLLLLGGVLLGARAAAREPRERSTTASRERKKPRSLEY